MNIFDRLRPYPELKSGIVNMKTGTAFKAVILKVSGPFIVLRNVEMIQDRGNTVRRAVDGEVIVERSNIDFVQVL